MLRVVAGFTVTCLLMVTGGVLHGTTVAAAQDTSAVAVNKQDGKSVFKLSFAVKRVMDDNVDAQNAAVAYASCNECQTVATSIQVVLMMDDATSVTTGNVAIAINYQCTECDTLAAAYQYVFGDGAPVRFSAEGNRRLADIRRRFQALRQRDDLTLDQLAQAIAGLAGEVAAVVDTELVPTGPAGAPSSQETTTTTEATVASSTTVAEPVTSTTATVAPTTTAGPTTTTIGTTATTSATG